MDVSEFPSSEAEFRGRFTDEDHCREYLARLKWPEGFRCAHCAGGTAYFLPSKRVVYECAHCGRQVSVIARDDLRTEQEAARPLVPRHLRGHRVEAGHLGRRAATQARARQLSDGMVLAHEDPHRHGPANREPLAGEVEIDESYVGGPKPGQPGRAAEDKAIVAAAVEKRGKSCGRVRLGVIANVSADILTAFVDNHLGHGETAHTDGWRGYARLGKTGYRHIVSVLSKLDQTAAEVLPRVHLIFSLLKRWLLGTHQGSVSLKHLDGYLEEFSFRFNAAAHAGLLTAPGSLG